jgi:hypothetical protein
LRRQADDHHFGSLIILAITAGAFLLVAWIATKALIVFLREAPIPLKPVGKGASLLRPAILSLVCSTPQGQDQNRGSRSTCCSLYHGKKWDMAAAVASHLVKVEPQNEAWWINLAYSVRRSVGIEQAEAILLGTQAIHPKVAMIAFNLACYASVTGRMEDAKERIRKAIELDKDVRILALADEDL